MTAGHRYPSRSRAAVIVLLLPLAACDRGEPTEAEIFDTLNDFGPTKMLLGDLPRMQAEARKTNCENVGGDAYKCGVTSKVGKGLVLKYIFTRAGDKWHVLP